MVPAAQSVTLGAPYGLLLSPYPVRRVSAGSRRKRKCGRNHRERHGAGESGAEVRVNGSGLSRGGGGVRWGQGRAGPSGYG